eukprot:TRINITY_DN10512_c0_g1_i1.p1 TRINITY_DN10512_c0_g1~~TRINITY_DN10512_c0_g1_i1.p1  ORF type:complete len:107 (+),score=7.45 TRINITY_DN10512_c0_g1_i1:54-374(+)
MSIQPCKTDKSHLATCNYGLVKLTDMPEEMRAEAKDTVVTALEKNPDPDKYEAAAKFIKDVMDKKFGHPWHCVIGEGFGFEITYELKHLMYMYFGGNVAILLFKAL